MPRYWKRKVVMKDGEPIVLKRLVKFGDSFAFVLPKEYIRFMCSPDKDGRRWVEVKYSAEDGAFTIKGFEGMEQ